MPISSGALGWPASFFSKPEQEANEDSLNAVEPADLSTGNDQIWRVKLADREEYDSWKKIYDKEERKKRKKKKKRKEKEQTKRETETPRDHARAVLRRRRLRRCVLASACVLLVCSVIFYGLVFLYTNFLEEGDLPPLVALQTGCGGQLGKHYLVFDVKTLKNGTHMYSCCFLPDVLNKSVSVYVLSHGPVWPDGYLIQSTECHVSGKTCQQFEQNGEFDPGTPPCVSSAHVSWLPWILLYTTIMSIFVPLLQVIL